MEITILPSHLLKAIQNRKHRAYSVCAECVVAVAVKDAGFPDASVGNSTLSFGANTEYVDLPDEVTALITMFDRRQFEYVRGLLPLTFSVGPVVNI